MKDYELRKMLPSLLWTGGVWKGTPSWGEYGVPLPIIEIGDNVAESFLAQMRHL